MSDTKARRSSSQENVSLRSSLEHLYGLGFVSGPFLGIWVAKMKRQLGLRAASLTWLDTVMVSGEKGM